MHFLSRRQMQNTLRGSDLPSQMFWPNSKAELHAFFVKNAIAESIAKSYVKKMTTKLVDKAAFLSANPSAY